MPLRQGATDAFLIDEARLALFAGFPAGTVSGAPKVRACEIIAELEPETRGAYAGGVGYFAPDGSVDSCIVLRTAVLKGLPWRQVILRHALRNAMIAPFTVILLQINWLIGGVVVTELVFAYPGFGRMLLDASLFGDVALIEAATLVPKAAALARFLAAFEAVGVGAGRG